LAKTSFSLPDDGIEMKNARVGPFCCTGNIVIVRSSDGGPVGYIYFYSWKGQAYNVEGGSIVPDISILVSGPATLASLGNSGADQPTSHIEFQAAQLNPQSQWIQAGLLQYRATVLDFKLERGPLFQPYFKMGSLKNSGRRTSRYERLGLTIPTVNLVRRVGASFDAIASCTSRMSRAGSKKNRSIALQARLS